MGGGRREAWTGDLFRASLTKCLTRYVEIGCYSEESYDELLIFRGGFFGSTVQLLNCLHKNSVRELITSAGFVARKGNKRWSIKERNNTPCGGNQKGLGRPVTS